MADCIAYQKTNYFSSLINDYLDQKESLKDFYENFPSLENFQKTSGKQATQLFCQD